MTEDDLQHLFERPLAPQDEAFVRRVMERVEVESVWPRALWVAAAAVFATFAAPHLAPHVVGSLLPLGLAIAAGVGAWAVAEASA